MRWSGRSRRIRGEVVLVVGVHPSPPEPRCPTGSSRPPPADRLAAGERTRGAVDEVAELFGVSRRRVYHLALATEGGGTDPVRAPEE